MLKKLISVIFIVAVAAGLAYGINSLLKKQAEPNAPFNAPKKVIDEVTKFNTPYFVRINMTPEQKKIHDKCVKEKFKALKDVSDKKYALEDELNKVKSSSLPKAEKDKKTADLSKQIKDLDAQSNDIEAKGMDKFEASLNPAQKAEYERFKVAFAKKYGPKK